MTLAERMRWYLEFSCRKHDLAPDATDFANEKINGLSNVEFMEELSSALEEININWPEKVQ